MSYTINLSDEQFAILQKLVNEGMETVLAPYDDIKTNEAEDAQITEILNAVAFFNCHTPNL
jgi:phosphoribosyl-ATP pyrophosphohydrolase